MAKILNIGIIGYGGMGGWHHEMIKKFDELEAIAVYDIKKAALEKARKAGIRKIYEQPEDIIADKEIDIILVATPNDVHIDFVMLAMNAGKHVICEKPVAMNSQELIKMMECAKENKVLFSIHQNRRWDSDYVTMRTAVEQGLLGKVYSIESRIMGSRGIPGDWRSQKQHGGGMMLDWGVHIIDQMLDMFQAPVKQVYIKMHHVRYDEVDDGFNLTLTFENDINVMLDVYTCAFINLPRWFVCGDNGTLIIEDWALNGKIIRPHTADDLEGVTPIQAGAGLTKTMAPRSKNVMEELPLPKVHVQWSDYYKNYVAAVRGEEELIVKPEQALRVMKVMDAAFQSEKEKKAIDVNI